MGVCLSNRRNDEFHASYVSGLNGGSTRSATVFPGQELAPSSYRTDGTLPLPEGLYDGASHPPRRFLPSQAPKITGTQTVRSMVNLKKQSLKLFRDSENSSKYGISFLADSTLPCQVTIFVMAYDKDHARTDAPPRLKSKLTKRIPNLVSELSGLDQAYSSPEAALCFESFTDEQLTASNISLGLPFPVVIRLQTFAPSSQQESTPTNETTDGIAKPSKTMQAQTTYCVLKKLTDGSYGISVVKQVLWVNGVSYLLREIFGIERDEDSNISTDNKAAAKECVICMSEARDTLALPCRHLCLCIDCAKTLRYQTNKCPMCRSVIQSLLQIKINSDLDKLSSSGTLTSEQSFDLINNRSNPCRVAPANQRMETCS